MPCQAFAFLALSRRSMQHRDRWTGLCSQPSRRVAFDRRTVTCHYRCGNRTERSALLMPTGPPAELALGPAAVAGTTRPSRGRSLKRPSSAATRTRTAVPGWWHRGTIRSSSKRLAVHSNQRSRRKRKVGNP
jgi:hypothetical protein